MIYYALLTLATLIIAGLALAVWWKTRQVGFIIGFAFLYYWSLYGGWLVVSRELGYGRDYRFEYLYYKLFPVYLDQYYVWTLMLYATFIVAIQVAVLHVARPPVTLQDCPAPVVVSHGKILALAAVLAAGAYGIVWDVLLAALASGGTGYGAVANAVGSLFSVYQILHEAALTLTLTGLAVYFSGSDARYIRGRQRGAVFVGYLAVFAAIAALNLGVGNRSMLFYAALGAGLFYVANAGRPNKLVLAAGLSSTVLAMALLGVVRGASGLNDLSRESPLGKARYLLAEVATQDVEAFSAHASLYGTLQKHVPLTYGSSFVWLAGSIIPGPIRPDLGPIVYSHYASHVGAPVDQGVNVHHATGWYLNFGAPGLLLGALAFGCLWAVLFNNLSTIGRRRSLTGQLFATLAFWNFTAYIPMTIRTGPEGYKAIGMEALLIPTLLVAVASLKLVKRENRPCLVPMRAAAYGPAGR